MPTRTSYKTYYFLYHELSLPAQTQSIRGLVARRQPILQSESHLLVHSVAAAILDHLAHTHVNTTVSVNNNSTAEVQLIFRETQARREEFSSQRTKVELRIHDALVVRMRQWKEMSLVNTSY